MFWSNPPISSREKLIWKFHVKLAGLSFKHCILDLSMFYWNLFTYSRFQEALVEYGVDKEEIFQTNDLTERKDIANVTNTLYALGRAVSITISCTLYTHGQELLDRE